MKIVFKASVSFSGIDYSSLILEADKRGTFKTPYGEFYLDVERIEAIDIIKLKKEMEENLDKNMKVVQISCHSLFKTFTPPSLREKYKNIM